MTRECEFTIELSWHGRPHLIRATVEADGDDIYVSRVRLVRTDLAGHAYESERLLDFSKPAQSREAWKLEDEVYYAARSEMENYYEAMRDEWADRQREEEWVEKHFPEPQRAFEW